MKDDIKSAILCQAYLYTAIYSIYSTKTNRSMFFRMEDIESKITTYRAKLEATRRELDVVKTTFFKAKTATKKINWPNKPPTEKMRSLLKIVSEINKNF